MRLTAYNRLACMNIWVRPSRASRSVVCDPSSRPPLCPLVANSRPCRWGARWQMRPTPHVSYTLSQWLWHRQFYLVVCRGQCIRRPLCTTMRSHRDTCQSQCPTWQHLLPQQGSSYWAAATIDTTCRWHIWRTALFVRLSPFKFKRWKIKVYLDFGIHQVNRRKNRVIRFYSDSFVFVARTWIYNRFRLSNVPDRFWTFHDRIWS